MKKRLFILAMLCTLGLISLTSCEETENNIIHNSPFTVASMRIPMENKFPGLDYFEGDEAMKKRVNQNHELFGNALTQIVAEVIKANIPTYNYYNGKPMDTPQLLTEMYENTLDKGHLVDDPQFEQMVVDLTSTMEVIYRLRKTASGLEKTVENFRLIWRDPAGTDYEKMVGIVRIDDLSNLNLTVQNKGKSHDLVTFLENEEPEMFPILTEMEKGSFGVKTLEEAYKLKEDIYSGNFVPKELFP